ncbi:RNA-directed DNA polymerase, eukaryota, reverse transcriptase zinc-binding domain protein, partial [Tanacetum coccineum]
MDDNEEHQRMIKKYLLDAYALGGVEDEDRSRIYTEQSWARWIMDRAKGGNSSTERYCVMLFRIYTNTNTNEGVKETSSSNPQFDKSKAKQVDNISGGKNQFDMLNEVDTSEGTDMSTLKGRMLVDMFLTKKLQPTCAESSNWSVDMIKYFKDKWNVWHKKGRILVSWDKNKVDVNVLYSSRQTMLCLIETVPSKSRLFCSFVYAANSGSERKELWKDIQRAKKISYGWPWLLTGDFNVTLKNEEHSNGGSKVTNDMQDFIDCTNEAEVEDLCGCGIFYTWIKSPLNPQNSVLKKLDRAMVNEELLNHFPDANAIFLPYMVSDHSPVVVRFPYSFDKKKKAFRFANFITERDNFLPTVAAGWKIKVHGHKMYKLVKKMKALKHKLKEISWK